MRSNMAHHINIAKNPCTFLRFCHKYKTREVKDINAAFYHPKVGPLEDQKT